MTTVTFNPAEHPLTEEQRAEIREASKRPITFDEDCPELTEEQIARFMEQRHKKEGIA